MKHLRAHIYKLPSWLAFIILEAWPIMVLLFALLIEFRHIAYSSWLQVFLYNGDSLTLPVIRQTLAHKEPFLWVSSSQFLLFPEGLFYAISSAVTKSMRASLVFNGVLNMVVLYALFRCVAGTLAVTTRYLKQLFALGCCLLLIFYMILERQPLINSSSVATLFIFTSYYYGVIISGAALLGIMLQQTKDLLAAKKMPRLMLALAFVSFLIVSLTTFSNPIFVVQFTLPLLLSMSIAYLYNGLRLKDTLLIGLPLLLGSAIGYVARLPFKAFVGVSLGSHIVTQQIPGTLYVFNQAIRYDLHSKAGFLELLLVLGVIAFSVIYVGWWIYQKTHHNNRLLDGRLLLLALFSVIEPFIIIIFSISIGSVVTRYLLPMFIFPLLGLLPLLASKSLEKFRKVIVVVLALVILLTILLGTLSAGKANYVLSSSSYTDAKCLATALNNKPATGIGSYWSVRALNVYGQLDEQALQVSYDLSPFVWQANLGSYKDKNISFVVVEKQAATNLRAVPFYDPSIPAHPSKIYNCSDIYVYIYMPGTSGYYQLNNSIHNSYNRLLKARATGNILQSY